MTESAVLYRKYRPQTFAAVRDQDHIVTVLEGAIKKSAIPHALLFAGTRGTGKTTMARIFAHAVGAKDIDIYEIDAASNRGIDDIRELREAIHTAPYESPYKVYIIDEVHMLTKEAFNALLKTLEEPPSHVIFILATTEEEKLLDTILSRCQVFRFRSPSRSVLAETVTDVAKKEGYTLTPAAADLIAVAADGSFRDALSITGKVLLATIDTNVSEDVVAHLIGAPKAAILTSLLTALHTKDTISGTWPLSDEAVALHIDMKLFIRLVIEAVRAVMILRHDTSRRETILAPFGPELATLIGTFATESTSALNSHLLIKLLEAADRGSRSPVPQLPLEIAIVTHGGKE
jgi:DNA polymerase-3 subunit gamma/tau